MLGQCAHGFGAVALTGLLCDQAVADGHRAHAPLLTNGSSGAKSVIFLYMDGGPSQVDTFDPKPRLWRDHGKPFAMEMERTQFNDNGTTLRSPWTFRRYGASGIPVSDLFPHVAECVDDLCVIRSMTSNFSEHTNANYFLHTGMGIAGRPSMGAWASYGLGRANENLPAFVVLNGGLTPPGGLDCFSSGFLPAQHQASVVLAGQGGFPNIERLERSAADQKHSLDFIRQLDQDYQERIGRSDPLEAAIANHELAFRMQWSVPELMAIDGESKATKSLYGLDEKYETTRIYGRQCLLARRLVERGVRFVELTCPALEGDRWDQHDGLKEGHENNARAVDQPIAGLLKDLKSRGLLDQTLVIWAAEFGRTPFAQGVDGRDHNPFGFTIWMAGGGIRGGMTYGSTDEFGYKAIDRPVEIHDLHATMLHAVGIDHRQLTMRHGGRDMRLTDVHGHVLHDIFS